MMRRISLLFVFAFFVFPLFVFAQNAGEEAAKEKLRQETGFFDQILNDSKNLRLPENRALIRAKIGSFIWQTDEKRARAFFQEAVSDLLTAQTEAENAKGNKQFLNNLIYGQSPRWEILYAIGSRDAEFALDAMLKTRPTRVAQAILTINGDDQSISRQFAKNEIQFEQRLIAMAAEQSPQNAAKLLRESLKKDVTYDAFNLLKKIYQTEPETANQLAEEVGRKLVDTKLDENNQDSSLIQYFLSEFGRERTLEDKAPKVSDQLLRELTEKILKFMLRPNATSYYSNSEALKVIEKIFPAAVAQLKQKQARFENQNQGAQYQNYNKLMQRDADAAELLNEAEKFPRNYRNEIYRRAAEKTAQDGNVAEAQKIIISNLSDEEAERYLSQLNYTLASQAISQGKFEEANGLINQMSDENARLNAFVYLATSIYQKNPKDNQKWASSVLDQAFSLIPDAPEKLSDMNNLLSLVSGYAVVEPEQAFRKIDALIAPLNEYAEASAVIAKYNDYGNFRQGEFQIGGGNASLGVYNLPNVLQTLKAKDFARTIEFTNRISRPDVRIGLQIQLLDFNLPFTSSKSNFVILDSINMKRMH